MKILIVRVSSLGDVVHNMPMATDLQRHYPDAQIDWVVEEAYTSLVWLHPAVRNVIPVALRRWRKSPFASQTRAEAGAFLRAIQSERYDLVFDTQGLFKTGLIMRLARLADGGKRVGLANATEGSGYEGISRLFHTMSVPVPARAHSVLRARLVAAAALGYTIDDTPRFELRMPQADDAAWLPQQPYAVFFHGTARAAKRWSEANWIRLAQAVTARGMPVLLPWGDENERETAVRIAAGVPGVQVLPRLSLTQAVVLARCAALAVGTDSGLTHVAAAYERPTVELYCDSPRWKTEGNWSPAIVNLGELGAPPAVGEVELAVERVLQPAAGAAAASASSA